MRRVCLLGASGSIGSQTLDILEADRSHFELVGFSVGERINVIPDILSRFPSCKFICVKHNENVKDIRDLQGNLTIFSEDVGLISLIKECNCDLVVNALVGFAGLVPSVRALEENKILCLANKESLVVGGDLINDLLRKGKGKLYPIDSEHVAIAKLFSRTRREDIDTLYITASGGSFRNKSREELVNVTVEDALAHPTWSMGKKITIDSATMMNKGFEVIEAKVLFDFPLEKTKVMLHEESYVHSFLKMKDGSYLCDISKPDMHNPIRYALYESKVDFDLVKVASLDELEGLHFKEFDKERFPMVSIAVKAFEIGGTARTILNRSNEEAVYAFLSKKISFLDIEKIVDLALNTLSIKSSPSLEEIIAADKECTDFVAKVIKEL